MDRVQHQLSRIVRGCGLAFLGGLAAACGPDAKARGTAGVVDSIVPRDVALARFQTGRPALAALHGGAASREALVRAFVQALSAADTAALEALTLSRAEFAWLYYPTTPQSLPPYDLSPGLMWTLLELHGARGMRRALEEFAGTPVRYAGHTCDPRHSREGDNTLYGPCVVRLRVNGEVIEQRLFGLIIGRGGRFKFVSLANKLG